MTDGRVRALRGRHAGLLVPLSAIPSHVSWGIGEIPDLEPLGAWALSAGFDRIQILPVLEMAPADCSPYSALSAMAIDPMYVRLGDVEEFHANGAEASLDADARATLAAARAAPRIDFESVRTLKRRAFNAAFDRFHAEHWRSGSARAAALAHFIDDQSWWLDDYTLFRALQDAHPGTGWTAWPEHLRDRDPEALRSARATLERAVLEHAYVQWVAATQWARMRARTPAAILGDFPFMIVLDSADVWARQAQFRLDVTIGTPPDAFSATGQDWRLPGCRWDVMAGDEFAWMAARARRYAALFDGYRLDHVVGLYRTYMRPVDGRAPFFVPADEAGQRAQGERLVRVCANVEATVIAEDLGSIPDFVRASLVELGTPGYRVLRWERDWTDPQQAYLDPAAYPANSVATSGTHDTTTLAGWWEESAASDRAQLLRLPGLARAGVSPTDPFGPPLRDALLRTLLGAGSDLVILPVQDVFGWTARINSPGTIAPSNWTFRLPWPVDDLARRDDCRERATALSTWSDAAGRGGGPVAE